MAERIAILDVPVDALTGVEHAIAEVEAIVRRGDKSCQSILAVNPEKVMAARANPALLAALSQAGLLVPDGIGVVLAARSAGYGRVRRVPGIELMDAICARSAERKWPIFLLGARPDVNERAARQIELRFPGIVIAGRRDGYRKEEADAAIVDEINRSGAIIIFVALGSPKQELWIERYRKGLQARICQGVGGSFDVLAGEVRRAPAVLRRLNLEWSYRLARQPSRLFRQSALPRFAWAMLRGGLVRRKVKHQTGNFSD